MPPGPEGQHGGYPTVEDPHKQQEKEHKDEFIEQNEVGQYKMLYDRAQELETDHFNDLLFAFAGGFLSLTLLLFAGRAWTWLSPNTEHDRGLFLDAAAGERISGDGAEDVTPLVDA